MTSNQERSCKNCEFFSIEHYCRHPGFASNCIDYCQWQRKVETSSLTSAAQDVLAERRRQIDADGWTPEHDDEHLPGELALAAASYVCADEGEAPPAIWPWDWAWWKPESRRRNLVKAAALILAEIERLDRAEAAKAKPQPCGD